MHRRRREITRKIQTEDIRRWKNAASSYRTDFQLPNTFSYRSNHRRRSRAQEKTREVTRPQAQERDRRHLEKLADTLHVRASPEVLPLVSSREGGKHFVRCVPGQASQLASQVCGATAAAPGSGAGGGGGG